MKIVSVSLTIWFAQVLRVCALHENPTQELDVSMTTSQKAKLRTKTETMTTAASAEEPTPPLTPTLEPSGFTSSLEDVRTFHHYVMSLTSRVMAEYQEPGNGTESTRRNIPDVTESSTSRRSIQLEHDSQTTSTSWTEDKSRDTDGANTTTAQAPPIFPTELTDITLTGGSPALPTAEQTSPDVFTNTVTPAGTSGHVNITAKPLYSTQDTKSSTENSNIMDWRTLENTEVLTTSSENKNNDITNTSWRDGAGWSSSTNTSEKIFTSEPEAPAGTSESINTTDVTSREHSTEETLVSSTRMMDWRTQENTEALSSQRIVTNPAWIEEAWSTNTRDTWSTNITTTNISTSETETPTWTNCFSEVPSSHPHRSSNLLCFLTLWTLSMTASVFLGLSVFLWVRLSTARKRVRLRRSGRRDTKRPGPASKETESLWAEPDSSAQERVEFWYANGATVEDDSRRKKARRARTRESGEEDMDMWIQPQVTMKDITEFWCANGRVRQDEETPCEL